MILSTFLRYLVVLFTGIFSILFCRAQEAESYLGKLLYVSVDLSSYAIDSIHVYYSKDRILLIYQPGEEGKGMAYRKIADLKARKNYWIFDSKQLILEEKITAENSKRAFEELPGKPIVQNIPTRAFISELKFPTPSGSGLQEYILKLLVAGMDQPAVVADDMYLVDYGFFRGRVIMKKDSDAYFADSKDRSRKSTFTLMRRDAETSGPSASVPAGYKTKEFSLHEFFTAYERPAVDDLIRFYLEGSLKN